MAEPRGKQHCTLLTWGALEAVMPSEVEVSDEFWLQGKVKVLSITSPAKDPSARRVTLLLDEIVIDSYEANDPL